MAGLKLKDVAKGVWAVRAVPLRLANAAAPAPGQPADEASATIKVGVRVLLGTETADVYEKAQELAREKGVSEWKDEHPICRLYETACALLFAVCDVDQTTGEPIGSGPFPDRFFESVEQVLSSKHIGTDNIAYLHEQWVQWQDAKSQRNRKMSVAEAIGAILIDMEAPDSPESPLLSMGHASLVNCTRTMARLWFTSLTDKSPSGVPGSSSTESISKSLLESGLLGPDGG